METANAMSMAAQIKAARIDVARQLAVRERQNRSRDEIRMAREHAILAMLPEFGRGRPVPSRVFAEKFDLSHHALRELMHRMVVAGQVEYIRAGDYPGYVKAS